MSVAHVCDGVNRTAAVIAAGDLNAVIRMALAARFSDERCSCTRPILTGRDLMCACCQLESEAQIEARMAAMQAPHPFEESDSPALRKLRLCALCSMWEDDTRHTAVTTDQMALPL